MLPAFIESLKNIGWEVTGGLDNIPSLTKNPKDSRLRAKLRVECQGDGNYAVRGVLEAPNVETILGIGYSAPKYMALIIVKGTNY